MIRINRPFPTTYSRVQRIRGLAEDNHRDSENSEDSSPSEQFVGTHTVGKPIELSEAASNTIKSIFETEYKSV